MAEHKTLKKALQQMAEGSRSGFHTFYLGTSQYVYSSALLLYDSHEDACRFMVDFYQYLYLHLPEYDRSANLENWIARLLMDRYEQLSIGRNMPTPSVKQKMDAAAAQLSKSEQERVWRMLDVHIHFPKDTIAHRSPILLALLISVLLLALLIASRYAPAAIERLRASSASSKSANETEDTTGTDSEASDTDNSDDESDDETQTDELESIRDDLENLSDGQGNTDTENSTGSTDALQMQQSSGSNASDQTSAPSTPIESDTPQEPDQPQEPQTPSLSEDSGSDNDSESLEDLELQLHYGDSLLFTDSN